MKEKFLKLLKKYSHQTPKYDKKTGSYTIYRRLPNHSSFLYNGFDGFMENLNKKLLSFGFKTTFSYMDNKVYIKLVKILKNKENNKYQETVKKYLKNIKSTKPCNALVVNKKTKQLYVLEPALTHQEAESLTKNKNKNYKPIIVKYPREGKSIMRYDNNVVIKFSWQNYSVLINVIIFFIKENKLMYFLYNKETNTSKQYSKSIKIKL